MTDKQNTEITSIQNTEITIIVEGDISGSLPYNYNKNTNFKSNLNTVYVPTLYNISDLSINNISIFLDKQKLQAYIKKQLLIQTDQSEIKDIKKNVTENIKIINNFLFKTTNVFYIKGNKYEISKDYDTSDISYVIQPNHLQSKNKMRKSAMLTKYSDILNEYEYVKELPNYTDNKAYYDAYIKKETSDDFDKFNKNEKAKQLYIDKFIAKAKKEKNVKYKVTLFLLKSLTPTAISKISCANTKKNIQREINLLCASYGAHAPIKDIQAVDTNIDNQIKTINYNKTELAELIKIIENEKINEKPTQVFIKRLLKNATEVGNISKELSDDIKSLYVIMPVLKQKIKTFNNEEKKLERNKASDITTLSNTEALNQLTEALINKLIEKRKNVKTNIDVSTKLLDEIKLLPKTGIKIAINFINTLIEILNNRLLLNTLDPNTVKLVNESVKSSKNILKKLVAIETIINTKIKWHKFNKKTRKISKFIGNPLIDFKLCKSDNKVGQPSKTQTIEDLVLKPFPRKLTTKNSKKKAKYDTRKKAISNFFK
jgi:hypothetical protein